MSRRIIRRTREQVLRRWVRALEGRLKREDGKPYTQGRDFLRNGDNFCCLGVLCDLAARDGGPQWEVSVDTVQEIFGRSDKLTEFVRDFMGLSFGDEETLIDANDKGESFPEIAGRIRREFLKERV